MDTNLAKKSKNISENKLHAPLSKPAIMDLAEKGDAHFFIQFSGQAGSYIDDLKQLYAKYPAIRGIIELAAHTIDEEMKHAEVKVSGLYHFGFNLLQWITDDSKSPKPSYFASSVISQPLIFLTQIVQFQVVKEYGQAKDILNYTRGLTGHSQGIMAAILVAMDLEGDEYADAFGKMVRFLFWQGLRMQKSYPAAELPSSMLDECHKNDWGKPTPMAAVNGLLVSELQAILDVLNQDLAEHEQVSISLENTFKRLVVCGSPKGLVILRRAISMLEKKNEKKLIKHSGIQWEFLAVTAPYHTKHMADGLEAFRNKDQAKIDLKISGKNLKLPVYATNDGRNLQRSADVVEDLLVMQYLQSVDWNACTYQATSKQGVTHILDFGPGETASTLTFMNREGQGVSVIACATDKGRDLFLTTDVNRLPKEGKSWASFAPKVTEVAGKKYLSNAFTEFTGFAPIFGGGMTPTTVETDIVAAAANEGYLVEWAGGGQVTEAIFRTRLEELKQKMAPGKWIVFNALYLDAYLWNLHFPLLLKAKKEGYPIEGLTISAGVPTREKAKEIIAGLDAAGIWCISFKPGSDSQIRSVLEIAEDHPGKQIIMQVEGGKAGGHHSWEDLNGLLERNYARIRRHDNIILCAGGGIGLQEQAHQLLMGNWHEGGKCMPVDGVILGTRLMACSEAKTSHQIKELLVEINGTKDWVEKHDFNAGMTSGQSQLGADVHYADNKTARVADFIDQISDLNEEDILEKTDEIIARIDKTAKPFFGHVKEMTYTAVLQRMVELMAPGDMPEHFIHDAPFFDATYRVRVFNFARRMVERLAMHESKELSKILKLESSKVLDDPELFLKKFLAEFSNADVKLHPEDVDYFFNICRMPGKPVNFVPVIDKNIKRWFKSDSLWQAHDPRYSAEQVLTIPGPEAVKGITRVDEPIASILKGFTDYTLDNINGETEQVNYVGASVEKQIGNLTDLLDVSVLNEGNEIHVAVKQDLKSLQTGDEYTPEFYEQCLKQWQQYLSTLGTGPISALCEADTSLYNEQRKANFIPQLLFPKQGIRLQLELKQGVIVSLSYFDNNDAPQVILQVPKDANNCVQLFVYHKTALGKEARLDARFECDPQDAQAPLKLDGQFKTSLRKFYEQLWLNENKTETSKDVWQKYSHEIMLSDGLLKSFAAVVGEKQELYLRKQATPSIAIALFWQPLAQCLLNPGLDIDLLSLLHLSNEFEFTDLPLASGQSYTAELKLVTIKRSDAGKLIEVQGELTQNGNLYAKITSKFLIREPQDHSAPIYQAQYELNRELILTDVVYDLLKEKNWFTVQNTIKIGDALRFNLSVQENKRVESSDYKVSGGIYLADKKIGAVDYIEKDSNKLQNPVLYFINAYGVQDLSVPQEEGFTYEESIVSPLSNEPYAVMSQDLNPIHTDERLAAIAALPKIQGKSSTIVHGMWSSAAALAVVQKRFPKVISWQAGFMSMVFSGQSLRVQVKHVANRNGNLVLKVALMNELGDPVMQGEAVVSQERTAYVFTGQGSQVQGMGMAAYDSSEEAKKVWDRVDSFCQKELGFSIIKVVRDNPKEMLVNGQKISHPKGVLHLTQFTQVALTVLTMAQTTELRAASLFHSKAMFAGHSLGEYAALSCFDIMSGEEVVRVVYNRGLTMQNYVPRDENGKSPFGMMVVRPKIVGWSQKSLEEEVVSLTKAEKDEAIYVVNYNIEGSQYAVTGHLGLLHKLEEKLLKRQNELGAKKPACIWVEGVDVPFHSPLLEGGVDAFRKTIEATIGHVDPELLIDRYIPNLNAVPFSLEKEYVQAIYEQTKSSVLEKVLEDWSVYDHQAELLARLILIELLAYQFASPVRWINTQKAFLTHERLAVDKVIEFGPSPVLSNMMKATLMREKVAVLPQIYQFDADREKVFYNKPAFVIEAEAEEEVAVEVSELAQSNEAPQAAIAAPVQAVSNVSVPDDKPFGPSVGLKTLLALKLKIRLDEIKDNDTIEALSGGNSARRNELLTDVGNEFGVDAIDDGHQMPLIKLIALLEQGSDYQSCGTLIGKSIERALKESLALNKAEVMQHVQKERLLPVGLANAALCYVPLAVRGGNSNKSGPLSGIAIDARITDKVKSIQWLDSMVDAFGSLLGIAIPHASQMQGSSGESVSEEALNEWQEKYFGKESFFAGWAKDLTKLCGLESTENESEDFSEMIEKLKLYQEAFGSQVEKVIQPRFDTNKHVSFVSYWNWARAGLVRRFWKLLSNQKTLSKKELYLLANKGVSEFKQTVSYFADLAEKQDNHALAESLKQLAAVDEKKDAHFKPFVKSTSPSVHVTDSGKIEYLEKARYKKHDDRWLDDLISSNFITSKDFDLNALQDVAKYGLSLKDKVTVITGASPGSIAWEILKAMLMAGAKVVATTTSYNEKRLLAYRRLYQEFAGKHAELHIVPFSQGSKKDVDALIDWCFKESLIPDFVFPFGAVGEIATLTMMNPDSSTATLRVLLQGVEWLTAAVARKHKEIFANNHQTTMILPLSPNHGVFGGDGAYADAKLGLESLMNKWHGEYDDWGRHINLIGSTIGWVRGTGLMEANNVIAATMEQEAGVRTFGNDEMGFLLASLCHEDVVAEARLKPVNIHLTGGFEHVPNIAELAKNAREKLEAQSKHTKLLNDAKLNENEALFGEHEPARELQAKAPLANFYPDMPSRQEIKKFQNTAINKLDASKVVVVVGYGEVSPFGSSKPRWDMECGNMTQTGAIELAWIMGLIKYEDGTAKIKYQGWVDVKSGKPVADDQVWTQYKDVITENTGIRFADPEMQNFDPKSVLVLTDITLEADLNLTVEDRKAADEYLTQYSDAIVREKSGEFVVTLPKGSLIKVPRRTSLSRWVAGQVPKGWDATRFGVPQDLASQIDRTTVFNLVSSAQSFMYAGIEADELKQGINPNMIANSQGGGMGGMTALTRMYHDHREDKERQGDTLQETLINVGPAWVTQSLVGSYGPMVHPVAACATSLVSLSVGYDLIGQGKADFVVAGGYDDYSEEGAVGFQDMQATCDTQEMLDKGMAPKAMSRPNDSRRGGFVEAQGGGTMLLSRLDKAIELGLPIYSILGLSTSYSDGIHTSIPAPGLGLLSLAQGGDSSPLAQALKGFGMTADDVTAVSKHDTSTAANDPNENKLHDLVQKTLGRTPGNPLYVHSQKAACGHAKGGAGAWQAMAAMQMMQTGFIPGNKNLDDIDPKMREFDTMSFDDQTLNLGKQNIHSVLMTSLGFGHVGAACLMIHPNYALASLDQKTYEKYSKKRNTREEQSRQKYYNMLMDKEKLYQRLDNRPAEKDEVKTLLAKTKK
jgi:fatty acid synthase subunit beta, fungi type